MRLDFGDFAEVRERGSRGEGIRRVDGLGGWE
jgi:hypothetical protein